jgi:8-hydroxy-5-deazaflavin:NADPH oxidoreductase
MCSAKPWTASSSLTCFPQQRDGRIAAVENGVIESQWVERHLGRPVVKAFNNVQAADLVKCGLSAHAAGRIALPSPA